MDYIKSLVTSIFHGGSQPNSVAAQHAIANAMNTPHFQSDRDLDPPMIDTMMSSEGCEDYSPTDLRLVIIISGKRKSGKDHISTLLTNYVGYERMSDLAILRIAGPIKSQFARSHNLDFDRLLSASEYKENYRLSMVEWSERYREQVGWNCFLVQAIRDQRAKHKRVWILTDARRTCDIDFFEQDPLLSKTKIIKLRITATDATRSSRGWIFDERVDQATTECGLDAYTNWTYVIRNDHDNNKNYLNETLAPIYEAIDSALD